MMAQQTRPTREPPKLAGPTPAEALHRRRFLCALLAGLVLAPCLLHAQTQPESVGRMEGEDIAVKGAVRVEVDNGRTTAVLASGSEVTVRSGQARLLLTGGGEIGFCAPAHFSVLKSGGAVTLALDYGRVHARMEGSIPLIVYTPLIVATPMAIAGGGHDATVGLEATGAMCVLAAHGAVRIEQQLTGQSILVPQGGEVTLAGGQLDSLRGAAGTCQCEIVTARLTPSPPPKPPELSVPVAANLARPNMPPEKPTPNTKREEPPPPAIEEPIYKVLMPALTFDAAAPAPPPAPSTETILLVREVRVRPVEVFQGRVENPAATKSRSAPPATRNSAADPTPKKHVSVAARVGHFFRRIFSPRKPCAGSGCNPQGT